MFSRNQIETLGSLTRDSGSLYCSPLAKSETTDDGVSLADPRFWSTFGGIKSKAGPVVNQQTVMQLATVNACVGLIADCCAVLPLNVSRELENGGTIVDKRHWLYPLLHDQPNPWMSATEWIEMMTRHCFLRGEAYSYLDRSGDGSIRQIIPLHPDAITILKAKDGTPYYLYHAQDWEFETLIRPDFMFKLRFRMKNRYQAVSPIGEAMEMLGTAMALEEHAARMFGNGTRLAGVLTFAGELDEPQLVRMAKQWQTNYAGNENAFRTAILEQGWDWKPIGMKANEAQFLELMGYKDTQIMSLARIPPHMISHTTKATSWGTGVEQMAIGFINYTMSSWYVRWKQAIKRDMLAPTENADLFAQFNVKALLRGDLKARYLAYGIGRQWGWLSANDIRALEDENSIGDQGDIYLSPTNMEPADMLRQAIEDQTLPTAA